MVVEQQSTPHLAFMFLRPPRKKCLGRVPPIWQSCFVQWFEHMTSPTRYSLAPDARLTPCGVSAPASRAWLAVIRQSLFLSPILSLFGACFFVPKMGVLINRPFPTNRCKMGAFQVALNWQPNGLCFLHPILSRRKGSGWVQ